MIWLEGFNGVGVKIEDRAIKPLYARTQATPQAMVFGKGKNVGVKPGMVAAKNVGDVEANDGEMYQTGIFGSYGDKRMTDSHVDATVWVLSAGAMFEIERSAIDPSAEWDGANDLLNQGKDVLVGSNADGLLTIVADTPVAKLVQVGKSKIVITNANRLVDKGEVPVVKVALSVETPDMNGVTFANKDLGTLTENLAASVSRQTVSFTGKINHIADWTDFSAAEADRTGYYAPFDLEAKDGAVLVRQTYGSGEKKLVFGQTGDGAGKIRLVLSLKKDEPVISVEVYPTEKDANDGTNKNVWALDFSACEFGE